MKNSTLESIAFASLFVIVIPIVAIEGLITMTAEVITSRRRRKK